MAEKDKQIRRLAAWVDIAMQRPNIYAENYSHQGDTKMSERSGDKIDIGENYGVAGKEGNFENYGATGKEGKSENYGVANNKQGKIQDTTFAPTLAKRLFQQTLILLPKNCGLKLPFLKV
ncbi:hypothetical protein [Okeania sp. SIO2B3]|uniref:hypothetical protein n=1 Tax=Okeania sp. SIO2B3 TaxID=2607784 RepID=UPI0013C19019|nr:hypothetical protein [Okeania sp. SIO2B3]NET43577.1 hypothetical protein [Okeania sp. SIO2B3]